MLTFSPLIVDKIIIGTRLLLVEKSFNFRHQALPDFFFEFLFCRFKFLLDKQSNLPS